VKSFSDATRVYSFVDLGAKEGVSVVIGASSDATRVEWQNGYRPVETLCDEQARGPKSDNRWLVVYRVKA
jgi:hypothetical protein